jgi:hypothetical protein
MRHAALALILCGAALGAGCGESDGDSEPSGDGAEPATELTVRVDPDGPEGPDEPLTADVACPGDEAAVCDAVAAVPDDADAPVDPATPCTEIYGGPDSLTVTGTLRGEPFEGVYSRGNGCEIERFDRFSELLRVLFPDYTPGESLAP